MVQDVWTIIIAPCAAELLESTAAKRPSDVRRRAQRRCGERDGVDLIWNRKIDPGKVFDLSLPLAQVAEGYRAMDERRAIKTLLLP